MSSTDVERTAQPTSHGRARILSGMQPTSDSLHLGNYIGALSNWVSLQNDFEAYYFVADLHALTAPTDPKVLSLRSRMTAAQFIACGVNPKQSAVFLQSHIGPHAELGWVLNCLTGFGEASRMAQFKDKIAKGQNANVGLFTYPVLMAADILMYDAAKVPVGEDQRQHLEITRDLAERFNSRYGETFIVPEPHILKETAKVMDLSDPTAKMSGSTSTDTGILLLSDDPKSLTKKIKSAVTDGERQIRYDPLTKPGVSNLLVIHSALSCIPIPDLEHHFEGRGYGDLKAEVADVVVEAVAPFQAKMKQLLSDPPELDRVVALGADRARVVAHATMTRVRDRIGLLPARSEGALSGLSHSPGGSGGSCERVDEHVQDLRGESLLAGDGVNSLAPQGRS